MNCIVFGLGATALLGLSACADAPTNTADNFGYKGTGIAFGVSPLTLDALADACYSFMVVNGSDQLVVGRGPGAAIAAPAYGGTVSGTAMNTICASQFGNTTGGDISYVAPCDAQNTPDGNDLHTVTLWVDALCVDPSIDVTGDPNYIAAGDICDELQSYVNPCGSAGCSLDVLCVENADTPVTFNFTIMGQADQGFFDIAVNFDDVFCSAKLDDCNTNDEPIQLMFDTIETIIDGCPWGTGQAYGGLTADENLFDVNGPNPDGCDDAGNRHYMAGPGDTPFEFPGTSVPNPNLGKRIDTLVAAVACTAGSGANVTTHLTFTDLSVGCSAPGLQQGTLTLTDVTDEGNRMIGPFPSAVYFGTESLPNMNKVFTTVAIGIGDATSCSLQWQVIPSNGAQNFGRPGEYNSFGYVNFEGNGLGEGCNQNGLNDGGNAVTTMYYPTGPVQPTSFNSALVQDAGVYSTWDYICYNDAQAVAALAASVSPVGADLTQLEADVAASGNPAADSGLQNRFDAIAFTAAIRRSSYNNFADCVGSEAEVAAIDAILDDIEARVTALFAIWYP